MIKKLKDNKKNMTIELIYKKYNIKEDQKKKISSEINCFINKVNN